MAGFICLQFVMAHCQAKAATTWANTSRKMGQILNAFRGIFLGSGISIL